MDVAAVLDRCAPAGKPVNDRGDIAALAMAGILVRDFTDRPNAKPNPSKVAEMAVAYADALRTALKEIPDPHEKNIPL